MMNRTTLAPILSLALLGLCACTETANVQDLPAHVAFVGPTLALEDGQVETWFGLDDLEGATVAVDFAICPDGGGACLDITPLPGSVSLERVPVPARGASTPQRVVWTAPCDAHASSQLTAVVSVVGSDVGDLTSAPFVLSEVGACP